MSVINTEGRTCAGTDKGKSVKPHTPTVTQTQNSKSADASSSVKPIKGLDFHSSSFDVGENSKPKQPLKISKSVCQNTANFKGGQSILVKPSPNSQLAFHADARTGDGTANVKPRRRRYRKKKNSFNAFPKWGGHDHTGLGYNPPSCNSNMKSKSVHFNRSANSDNLTAFKNHICSLFDNYMRVDMPGNANAYSKSGSPHRERKEKMTKQSALPPVKSPKPKEKSEKDTSPVALSVSNGRTPMWQWGSHMWYFDSGAFRHVTGQRNILFDYVVRAEGFVKLVDKRRLPIIGYGSMTNGEHVIKNVRYVEGLPFNLLSSSQFCDGGYLVKTFILGSNIEDEDGNVILRAQRNGHLYTTMFYAVPQQLETVVFLAKATKEESWLWHQRLSHQNFRDMNKLVTKHLVNGLPETRLSKDTLCSACEKGKMKKSSHPPRMETNCHHPLDMLHMDLCGPMRVESLARKKYMLVLVDEYSRYTWLEFLRAKSDASDLIIAFIKRIQVLLGRQVKKLRSDNGTEFRNAKLQSFLEEVGISHNFSAVRTPQQNGVVERKNRTLVEAARSMIAHSGVPLSLWAEAVSTACYTQNRTLIVKRTGKTAYEMVNKRKPNIRFFRVFGCICYLLNNRDDLGKFDAKSDESIFIGYSHNSATYRVYNKRTRSIFESRYVDFSETEMYSSTSPSSDSSVFPELHTVSPPSTTVPTDSLGFDFIDLAEFDLPTLVGPIIVPVPADHSIPSSTTISADAFVNESTSCSTDEKPLQEVVYVEQPEGFVDPKYPEHVYVLDKALYGLKQAPRAWYETLTIYLLGSGYKKGTVDPTLFLRRSGNHLTVVQIYVDDIIFASTNPESCTEFEQIMKSRFQMSMMGELTFFLGLQVRQTPQGIFINQSKYTLDILKRFDFTGPKSASTPMSTSFQLDADTSGNPVDQKVYRAIIGSLLYLTASRPDIMFATCVCARFQCDPRESHLGAVKRILKYLKGTPNFGLWYPKDSGFELTAFTDSDHAGCKLNRKSTSGACQFLGDKLVSWSSRKQNCVSLSTAEAEYVAAACCCSQVLWMKIQLADYGYTMHRIPIYCDSSSAIQIAANPVQHSRTKHIDIRYHFIKDHVEKGNVELFFVESERQIADLFTKAFDEKRHYYLLSKLGMLDPPADF
ncbi:LOW QUALITY PROTEIN: hypothetical protein OSB04_002666 [Centaurea solstitialis]|uniref:Integrase catalytic domain-containing protein n=1 Tax=Centaurea solstitialis TaxID=347529 RepID=A0AA38TTE6_9ASTR|nr:LOW QUALITY PROTEIN: hypothetical protein OSB04_002666 [Centaurea solstitialis]